VSSFLFPQTTLRIYDVAYAINKCCISSFKDNPYVF
jgi:hypothetical protein